MVSDPLSSSATSTGGVATADDSGSDPAATSKVTKGARRASTSDPSSNRLATAGQLNGDSPKGPGKRIGRFRLLGVIGKGAMGQVFRAEDIQLHRLVALKVISSRSSRKITAAQKHEQFMREGRSSAKLDHPNIVSVYE